MNRMQRGGWNLNQQEPGRTIIHKRTRRAANTSRDRGGGGEQTVYAGVQASSAPVALVCRLLLLPLPFLLVAPLPPLPPLPLPRARDALRPGAGTPGILTTACFGSLP